MRIETEEQLILFGSRQIPYRLHLGPRKNLRIVVSPELTVDVFAPETSGDEDIRAAIEKKTPWITRTLDKLEGYHPLPSPLRYLSGETLVYLGRQYRLKVEKGPEKPAKLQGLYLRVRVADKTDIPSVKKSVDAWYRKRARETLGRYVEK